jgi:hypothetical protein
MMDLSALVQSKQLMHEGQFVAIGGLFGSVGWIDVHMVIEDWYDNNGYSLNKEDYEKHEEEYNNWRTQAMLLRAGRLRHRGDDGGDEHEPEKPTFLSGERQPRLLSEALASPDRFMKQKIRRRRASRKTRKITPRASRRTRKVTPTVPPGTMSH